MPGGAGESGADARDDRARRLGPALVPRPGRAIPRQPARRAGTAARRAKRDISRALRRDARSITASASASSIARKHVGWALDAAAGTRRSGQRCAQARPPDTDGADRRGLERAPSTKPSSARHGGRPHGRSFGRSAAHLLGALKRCSNALPARDRRARPGGGSLSTGGRSSSSASARRGCYGANLCSISFRSQPAVRAGRGGVA